MDRWTGGRVAELEKVLAFRVANLPDYKRVALETFQITSGLLSFFKTFWVAMLACYPGFSDSDGWVAWFYKTITNSGG